MSRLPFSCFLFVQAIVAGGSSPAQGQTPRCQPGLVYREAFPGDNVCVTPETHAQVMADNRDAMLHRAAPNKETCVPGYVWREASPTDHVCVTVQTRHLTDQDNQMAPSRMAGGGSGDGGFGAQMQGNQYRGDQGSGMSAQVMPGFHIVAGPQMPPRPMQFRPHPHPVPLTGSQLAGAIAHMGLGSGRVFPMPVPPNINYQLELFDANTGSEGNTNFVESTNFYGGSTQNAMGYIQITFNVNPGVQNVLDCSLGMDGSYRVNTSMTGAPSAEGTISSFNQHLMIPFSTAPANAKSAQAIIYFGDIEFDGCTVETISH